MTYFLTFDYPRYEEEAQDLLASLPRHLQTDEMEDFCVAIVKKIEEMTG